MDNINFRLAQQGDGGRAIKLFNELMNDGKYYFTNIYPFNEEEYGLFLEEMGIDNVTIFAETDCQLIAWANVTRKPFKFQRHMGSLLIGVKKEYRNMGIGTSLLTHIEKYAAKIKIEAQVRKNSQSTIDFLTNLDYIVEGVKKGSIKIGDKYDDEIILTKLIT